jgi:hypothetical protein
MTDIPDIAPMAEAAEEKRRRRFGDYRGPQSATIRPYDQLDIRLAGEALAKELALGGKVDIYMVARKMFDAAGVISSRATPRAANQKKEQTNAQPLEAQ